MPHWSLGAGVGLFRRKSTTDLVEAAIPPGGRVYAIGDVHGRLDLVEAALALIEADNAARPQAHTHLVFLGDLIDRGPQSAGVVERLRQLAASGADVRFLLGNHEEVLLDAIRDEKVDTLRFFCRVGGRETILSYGLAAADYEAMDYDALKAALTGLVPESHLAFLDGFEDMVEIGGYLFVHAGIRPGVAPAAQRAQDLRWIREPFLDHPGPHTHVVVHGHTIAPEVEFRSNRIGIDTGAFASGVLTALGLEGEERWVIQTR
jgi:serine/threonine protein phosphatase 1